MSLVKRDPFARTELHRELVEVGKCTCDWCGQRRSFGGKLTTKLYEYHTESDDSGRHNQIKGWFCSTPCMETYHS